MKTSERQYDLTALPFAEDLSYAAPEYCPERFTAEEQKFLNPFFSNLHSPVYAVRYLPEDVIGALSSRYSRSTESLRRTFLKEYAMPVAHPEQEDGWVSLQPEVREQRLKTKGKFLGLIDFWEKTGGIDGVINDQRAENFYDRWLALFGDDSIEEMGNIHLCLEGLSNALWERVVDKRLALSLLAKSTRFVPFTDKKENGLYRYVTPSEIRGTSDELIYRKNMDTFFRTFEDISPGYLEYIMNLYPRGEDESSNSFANSRAAKRLDDLRDLLPFGTEINVALNGNGRSTEDLINRLLALRSAEGRWWGKQIALELSKITPSFVKRSKSERGAEMQLYRRNLSVLREEIVDEVFPESVEMPQIPEGRVKLIRYTPQADVEVLSAFLFSSNRRLGLAQIRKKVVAMSAEERNVYLGRILAERKFGREESVRERDRHKKVPRAFENAHYTFETWARGGDYRDLHRHRVKTEERQPFTTKWGHNLEPEVVASPFHDQITRLIELSANTHEILQKYGPEVAEFPVLFTFLQHWYETITARELYWQAELRTGPQGRRHYKEICRRYGSLVSEVSPAVFQGLLIDWEDYPVARRESERREEAKRLKVT